MTSKSLRRTRSAPRATASKPAKGSIARTAAERTYQLKVTLARLRPPIWRRLLVPGSVSLRDLHDILQIAMGWTDSHLHQFEAKGQLYGIPSREWSMPVKNEARVRLDQVLLHEKDSMLYRARNAFGGMNVGRAVLSANGKTFKTNEMDGFTRLWNKECAGKSGTEAATAIRWFAL